VKAKLHTSRYLAFFFTVIRHKCSDRHVTQEKLHTLIYLTADRLVNYSI